MFAAWLGGRGLGSPEPVCVSSGPLPEQNPCFSGTHGCDLHAVCTPGDGVRFTCQCAAGFTGDGRRCHGNATHSRWARRSHDSPVCWRWQTSTSVRRRL